MGVRYTVDSESHKYSLNESAITVAFNSSNGSLSIYKDYREISIPFEMVEAFDAIYALVYQEFCDSKEQVREGLRVASQTAGTEVPF